MKHCLTYKRWFPLSITCVYIPIVKDFPYVGLWSNHAFSRVHNLGVQLVFILIVNMHTFSNCRQGGKVVGILKHGATHSHMEREARRLEVYENIVFD